MGLEWEPVTTLGGGATGSALPLPGADRLSQAHSCEAQLSSFVSLHQSNGQGEGRSRDSSSVISSDIEGSVTSHCPCSFRKEFLFINT